jgi:Sec-independent protein translocase protein TatA
MRERKLKDIEKQLKDLVLAHHSAIRDLKKQVGQLQNKLAAAESRKRQKKTSTKKRTNKIPLRKTRQKKTSTKKS